jgi:hypothetical protein
MYFCVVSCIFVLFYVLFVLFYVFLCCFVYFCVVLCIVCFVSFSKLFVRVCILYYCHRVVTQLQLNIPYQIMAIIGLVNHCHARHHQWSKLKPVVSRHTFSQITR